MDFKDFNWYVVDTFQADVWRDGVYKGTEQRTVLEAKSIPEDFPPEYLIETSSGKYTIYLGGNKQIKDCPLCNCPLSISLPPEYTEAVLEYLGL